MKHASRSTKKDSTAFSKINYVIERETFWNVWKEASCPSYEKIPNPDETKVFESLKLNAVRRLQDAKKTSLPIRKKLDIHLPHLATRQNLADINLFGNKHGVSDFLKLVDPLHNPPPAPQKEGVPSIGTLMENVFCDMDPDQGVEEEYKKKKDSVFVWKTLRAMANTDLRLFHKNYEGDLEKAAHELLETNGKKQIKRPEASQQLEVEENGNHKEKEQKPVEMEVVDKEKSARKRRSPDTDRSLKSIEPPTKRTKLN